MHRLRLFTLILGGACVLCVDVLRLGQTQSIGPRRLTNTSEEAINLNPSISGDGRIIAFESTEDLAAVGGGDHFRAIRANVNTDPATFVQMGGARAVSPAISQDGSRIAFASKDDPLGTNTDGNSEIFLFDGSRLSQVTNTSPGGLANRTSNGNFQPSISDDGRFIAFSSNRDLAGQNGDGNLEIFVFDSLSTSFTQLTNSSGIHGFTDAKISGNGNFVAYIRDNGITPATTRDLIEQPRIGGGAIVLASAVVSLAVTYGRAISDDGSRVVYSAQTAANTTQVFLYDGRGAGAFKQITSLGARVTEVPLHPSISGDGTRISFATRRNVNGGNSDGSVELYLYDLPTATFSKITNAPSGATADVISSLNDDGSIVAFNFPRVLSGTVTNIELANNSEIYLSTTQPRPGFGTLTILNGASLGNEPSTTKAIAPDSIAVARGGLLANSTQQPQRLPNGTFPTNVDGTTVTVNGRLSQIFFVSPGQVNFLVPAQTEIGAADVIVTNSEGFPSRGSIATFRAAPGVFTKSGDGTGEALVLNSDTLQEGPFDPGDGKLRLTIFATGARNATQLSVTIGGQAITSELVLASAEMPGLDEIHLRAPPSLKGAGVVNVSAQGDGREGNPVSTRFIGGDILINEVLADPPGAAPTDSIGDANHDGARSSIDDEFVELVNSTSHDMDISGYQLLARSSGTASDTLRHTFAAGTIVAARTAVVIFGGGAPNPSNPVFGDALILKASTGGLSLSNTGGIVTLRDNAGAVANIFEYGGATGLSGGSNQSLTRSPDITGAFTGHATATGAGGRLFSPGTRVDGTPFASISIARIDLTPNSPSIDAGAKQQFTARAFDAANQEVTGVIFTWRSSNPAVATIDQTGLATGSTAGTTQITASGRGLHSAPDTLTVRAVQRALTCVEVSPNPATIPATGATQFTARGLDQFGNEIAGLSFSWESSSTSVATIDQSGLATGIAEGQSTIKARAQNTTGTALLNVTPPTLVVNEVLADPPPGNEGDANHDGTRDGAQDEFVEVLNATGAALNISGWTLRTHSTTSTTETVRHTFAANTSVPAGNAMVVFGGGTFNPANSLFGCAQVVKASAGGLSLTNGGLTILIRDGSGNLVTEFSYGGATGLNGGNAQSLTRSPDITGDFVLHATPAAASGRKFSAGLNLDGTPFGDCPGHLASVNVSPQSASAAVGQSASFTAQAFDQFGRAMIGVPITFASDNAAVATIDSRTPNPTTGMFTASVGGHNPGTAHITASANDGTTTANSNQATLTVTGPALSINDVSMNEGNSGTTTFTFTVSLSQAALAGGVQFDIATQDGTATTAGNDYLARSLTNQEIPPGAATYSFDIRVNADAAIEPNETFLVNISNVSGASVAKGQGAATILNDDSPMLTVNDVTANEGDTGTTTLTFTVSSNMPAPAAGISFDIATANGTATVAGGDYVALSLTSQTIPAGQSSYSFDVNVNGDTLVESNENLFVNISNASANASISDAQGVATIQNDDEANLVISQVYPGGGLSGATFANDFIEIFNRGTTTVDFSVTPYSVQFLSTNAATWTRTELTSGTVPPGRYFLVKETPGGANGAALPTADATGTLNLTSTTAGKVALVSGTALLTGNCPGDEGTAPFNPLNANVIDFIGYGGSVATANHCYEGSAPATFSLSSNTAADYRRAGGCTDTNQNAADFFTSLPAPRNSSSAVNNCHGGVTPNLSINDVTVTEGNSGTTTTTFTVSLSAPSQGTDVTFDIATQDHTATTPNNDYVAKSLTNQIIPAGQTTYNFSVTINGDMLVEPDETFLVNVTNVAGALVTDGQAVGTIEHDDLPALSIDDVAAAEGGSPHTFTFHVTLSAPAPATVSFDITTADGTAQDHSPATEDDDYQPRSIIGQTIAQGSSSFDFEVTINGDAVDEPNETFSVNVTNVSGARVSDDQGVGTIQSDDAPPSLSITDVTQVETNGSTTTFVFTVQLSSPAKAGGVGFSVNTADGPTNPANAGSDYLAIINGSGSIAQGDSSTTVSVTVHGDIVFEPDETFSVNLTNVTGAEVTDGQGLGTITNDDAQPTIAIADAGIAEGASGTSLMTFTVTLNGTSQSAVSVNYATADSSATAAGSDYDATNGALNFAPGDSSETFTVTIHGDKNAEGDEMFLVELSSPSGATITDSQALGIIFMDDPFSVANVNMAYTENFDVLAQTGVSVTTPTAWTRAESGAGANTTYTANNGGSATGDTYSYGTGASSDRALGGLRTGALVPAVGAFYRNDTGSTINTLQIAYTGEEWRLGNAGRTDRLDFQFSLNATSLTTGTWTDVDSLDFTTPNTTTTGSKDGNNAINRTAIINTINGLSIAPGATFWIRWTDLDASGADDGLAVDDFSLTAGVNTPALSISDVTQTEGNANTTTFTLMVSLTSPAPPGGVSFTIDTANGTTNPATAGSDYAAIVNGVGSIAQSSTSTTVSVTVYGDTDIEPDETFFVNLSNVNGATVNDGQGLGTITNDDAPLASADLSVTKTDSTDPVAIGNDITYTITVTNAGPDAAANAVLADTVPANTTFRSITPPASWTCPTQPALGGAGAISCSNAGFAAGAAVFSLVVRVGTSVTDGAVISNTASVSSSSSDPNPGNESVVQTTTVRQPALVISQIYPGGGNAGATYTNDFIEIFNRGTTTVDFAATNYSLQYTGQAGNFGGTGATIKFDLTSGTIAPGQYFLVQGASGGVNGVPLEAPDAVSLIAMSATAGKVALVLGTVALAVDDCPGDDNVAPFNPNASTIVDFVGYGATAATANHCYEGTGPAPFSTSTAGGLDPDARSTIRKSNGCQDNGDNANDFTNPTTAPTARNKLITLAPCP